MAELGMIRVGIDASGARSGGRDAARALEGIKKAAEATSKQLGQARDAQGRFIKGTKAAKKPLGDFEEGLKGSGQAAKGAEGHIKKLVVAMGGIYAVVRVVGTLRDFEDGLVGVGKTTNIIGPALDSLGDDILQLGSGLRNGTEELLGIAQAAGQLGVSGKAGILAFTETVAMLGSASNLVGEEAATKLARMLNIAGEAPETVGTLAAVIVELGNNVAATEKEIAHTATQVALATSAFGVSSAEAAAFGATLAALGVRAELAGSSIGRSFRAIDAAVRQGGAQMKVLEKITGQTAASITKTFGESATKGFQLFIEGLGRIKSEEGAGGVTEALEEMGLSGEEILKVLPTMAGASELFGASIDRAGTQVLNATALIDEHGRAIDTLGGELGRVKNSWTAFQLSMRGTTGVMKEAAQLAADTGYALAGIRDEGDGVTTAAEHLAQVLKALMSLGVTASVLAMGNALVRLGKAMKAAAKAQGALNILMMANPWVAAVGVIAGLGAAYLLFSQDVDAATDAVEANAAAVERTLGLGERVGRGQAAEIVARAQGDLRAEISAVDSQIAAFEGQLVTLQHALEKGGTWAQESVPLGDFAGSLGLTTDEAKKKLAEDATPAIGGMGNMAPGLIPGVDWMGLFGGDPRAQETAAPLEDWLVTPSAQMEVLSGVIDDLLSRGDKLREALNIAEAVKVEEATGKVAALGAQMDATRASFERMLAGDTTAEEEAAEAKVQAELARVRAALEAAKKPAGEGDMAVWEDQIRALADLEERLRGVQGARQAAVEAGDAIREIREENQLRREGVENLEIEQELLAEQQRLREAGVGLVAAQAFLTLLREELVARENLTAAEAEAQQNRDRAEQKRVREENRRTRAVQQLEDIAHGLEVEGQALDKTGRELARFNELLRLQEVLLAAGADDVEGKLRAHEQQLLRLQEQDWLGSLAADISREFGRAFNDLILGAKSGEEALEALKFAVADLLLTKVITEPLVDALASALKGGLENLNLNIPVGEEQTTSAMASEAGVAFATPVEAAGTKLIADAAAAGVAFSADMALGLGPVIQAADQLSQVQDITPLSNMEGGLSSAAQALNTAGGSAGAGIAAGATKAAGILFEAAGTSAEVLGGGGVTAGSALELASAEAALALADSGVTASAALTGAAGAISAAAGALMAAAMMAKTLSIFGGAAKGASFPGRVIPFATGGVVHRRTEFDLAAATGVMGEAGPEAILPLSRMADGNLGVQTQGGTGQVNNITNVRMTVTTPDADSFRRSRRQITADLRRLG